VTQPQLDPPAGCRLAVILAAGHGIRLRSHSDLPKGLLCCGDASLLVHSIRALSVAGITDTIVVTGYRAELLQSALGAQQTSVRLHYANNADYAATGSMESLLRAAPLIADRSFILLESDLLFDPGFAQVAAAANDDVLLGADLSGSGDEVFLVADANNRLQFLGKELPPQRQRRSRAELAGISRISSALYAEFSRRAAAWIADGRLNQHYEAVLAELAGEGWPIRVQHCAGLAWTEIDTAADFERACRDVWPRVAAASPTV
jgi:choline kinase